MKFNKLFISMILIVIAMIIIVQAADVKYCCEQTTYNAWCQNAPLSECRPLPYKSVPTSCEATTFCSLGCCYDSNEGTCMENTPEKVCQNSGGTWSNSKQCEIPQCDLGCCVLGKQAAFVTLTRCKKLSGFFGLITDFRTNIGTELECISLASVSDEGACVYSLDYSKTCKFTTRQECNSIKDGTKINNGSVTGNVSFYKDYLCSAEELATGCGLTKNTICIEGKDEVYFKDSCGNPANIYQAGKYNDKSYWNKKIAKEDSCTLDKALKNSADCGNCDYFSGSICKNYKTAGKRPTYGDYICKGLNCKTTSLGKEMKHGEAWCSTDTNKDSVGSRYYRHLCINGEEIIEPCADYRQEVCIQDSILSQGVAFSQAACRVNRWQDCLGQLSKKDCLNTDKRDCLWNPDSSAKVTQTSDGDYTVDSNTTFACIPKNSPGLKFWDSSSTGVCGQANVQCIVTYEKKLIGSEKCTENCECLGDSWKDEQLTKCQSIGDCGAKINWQGVSGNKAGYKWTINKTKSSSGSSGSGSGILGGLF